MNRLVTMLRRLRQVPLVCGWWAAIHLAPKKTFDGIVVCDVSNNQSVYGEKFADDVRYALQKLGESSPKLLHRIKRFIRCIARAGIDSDFEYFEGAKLLLLRVDYGHGGLMRRDLIATEIVQAATLAYLRGRNSASAAGNTRVDRIMAKQRLRLVGEIE